MAGGTPLDIERLTLFHGTLADRKTLTVRTDVDIPAGDFLRGRLAADIEFLVRDERWLGLGAVRLFLCLRRCRTRDQDDSGASGQECGFK